MRPGLWSEAHRFAEDEVAELAEGSEFWVDALVKGKVYALFKGSTRVAEYGPKDCDEMVANFAAYQEMTGELPYIDANHCNAYGFFGDDAKLRAEVVGLRRGKGRIGVQARLRLTGRGADELKARDYRALSFEVARVQSKDDDEDILGTCIVGGTFCNNPFMHRMQEPAQAAASSMSELFHDLHQAAGRGAMGAPGGTSADPQEVSSMPKKLIEKLSEVHGSTLTEDQAVESFRTVKAEADKVPGLETRNAELLTENQRLQEEKATAETAAALSEEDRIVGDLLTDELISKAEAGDRDKPGFYRELFRKDRALFDSRVEALRAAGRKVTESEKGKSTPYSEPGGNAETAEDFGEASEKLGEKTRALMSEEGIEYLAAWNRVVSDPKNADLVKVYNGEED